MRSQIKELTSVLNQNKKDIDELKVRIDRKEEERKIKLRDEQLRQEDMFDSTSPAEEIIDEEELVLLKQMKDMKKMYRDCFGKLKTQKSNYADVLAQIDVIKERLISDFENWYASEFDVPDQMLENTYNQNLQNDLKANKADSVFGGSNAANEEDDQDVFMRAKRKVDVLARAKRNEKKIGVAAK